MKKLLAYAIIGTLGLTLLAGMWYQLGLLGAILTLIASVIGIALFLWALDQIP